MAAGVYSTTEERRHAPLSVHIKDKSGTSHSLDRRSGLTLVPLVIWVGIS